MGYPRSCVLGVRPEAQFAGLTLVAIALKIWLVQFRSTLPLQFHGGSITCCFMELLPGRWFLSPSGCA